MSSSAAIDTLARAADLVSAIRGREREAAALRREAETLAACSETRRTLVLAALATLRPEAYACLLPRGTEPLAVLRAESAYPAAPPAIQARIVLGESPAAISRGLTRAEAHRWLIELPTRPARDWLLEQHHLADHPVHSVRVARWLIACWSDPARREALVREREHEGPHGEVISGAYMDRIDELRDSDLRPSVEQSFRRAARRVLRDVEKLMSRKSEPLAPPPRWWRPIRCARLLLSAAELRAEGKIMRHCVATYVGYVSRRESVIVGITVCGHRSTVELTRDGEVRQHKGPANAHPHELCARALAVCLRKWEVKS